ncbi:hypothetical protein KAR91_02185 [Candidatus Pacearchaeota archaeon]|nr:hypothetical protein [Candidatus Pacearchaeota archaeon]
MTNGISVLLESGTVGIIAMDSIDFDENNIDVGEIYNVHLHDENGNPIEEEGKVTEIL